MSVPAKAVFLSYASQDAEAAKRIAEALRAAGVEVWFDQNELVGGDAWDAKIRKQIAECALFVPVISANTQARREGYFRIEWRLAAQRTHAMADGTPFLVPIVIDDTRDPDALVPAEFKAVQWTRLPAGATLPAFVTRVQRLLQPDAALFVPSDVAAYSPSPRATGSRSHMPLFLALAALLGVAFWSRPYWSKAAPAAVAASRIAEVDDLIGRARKILRTSDFARADLEAAELLAKRATEIDPGNAEAWAVYGRVHTLMVRLGLDTSPTRRAQARDFAGRAMRLAPQSFSVRYAQAEYWLMGELAGPGSTSPNAAAARSLLEELQRERPADPEVLLALAIITPMPQKQKFLEQVSQDPEMGWRALTDLGWVHYFDFDYASADAVADRSLAVRTTWGIVALKIYLAIRWHGDIELAQKTLSRMPPAALQEDWTVMLALWVADVRNDGATMLATLRGHPRDWLSSLMGNFPRSFLMGDARRVLGQLEAARADYRQALTQVDQRLASNPNDAELLALKAEALWWSGEQEAAREIYRSLKSLNGEIPFRARVLFEDDEAVIDHLVRMFEKDGYVTAAGLRLEPRIAKLRSNPRFQALLRRAESDPKRSPLPRATGAAPASEAAAADEKSVAVLAFANLSDDKANEYFSDGISEELLNVLAKVPGLKVSARTSAFHFKGKDTPISEIARQLGVAYVVEGSVRKAGDKVRITAQLIKAADGFHVWSDTFTRDLKDIFAVQDEIAGLIARNLSLKIGGSGPSESLDAEVLPLYYAALQAWNLRTLEGMDRAEALLNDALGRSPQFARGHAALAAVWLIRGEIQDTISPFGLRSSPLAKKIAAKLEEALRLDPNCAEAFAVRGAFGWDTWAWEQALADLRRATELNPNFASAYQWMGRVLASQGRLTEAIPALQRAAELDPLSPRILDNYGRMLLFAGRAREALEQAEHALALQPNAVQARGLKANALLVLGQPAAAAELARTLPTEMPIVSVYKVIVLAEAGRPAELEEMLPHLTPGGHISRIAALVALGRREEALSTLDADWITATRADMLLHSPVLDPLRDDPRFARTLQTLGLTEAHQRAQAFRPTQP